MIMSLPLTLPSRFELTIPEVAAAGLPLTPAGLTYSMTQEATWIDAEYFAVGRWDGSLGIFKFTQAPAMGPMIAKAVNSPDQEGLQMITPLGGGRFVSSNDEDSAIVWGAKQPDWCDLREDFRLSFDASFGVANSGAVVTIRDRRFFVMGHANGWLTIWEEAGDAAWREVAAVNIRSSAPVNPFALYNVRGIAVLPVHTLDTGYIVAGSEDGNLTVVRLPDGAIISTQVYNECAKRGINSLAVKGDILLVTNCAVGSADSNLLA